MRIELALDEPPCSMMIKSMGGQAVAAYIEFELIRISRLFSGSGNLNPEMIEFIPNQLLNLYPNESLADFKLCLERGVSGLYGPLQRLDSATIIGWMGEYLEEKYKAKEDALMKAKDLTPYEIPKPEGLTPKTQQDINAFLMQLKEPGNKVRSLTDAEIKQEGREKPPAKKSSSYQPNPEYAVMRLKEIEWMKQMFHPVTRERVENFLSFEEWIKQ